MKILTKTEIMMIGGGGESSVDTRTRVNHYGRGISANYGEQTYNPAVASTPAISSECASALGFAVLGGVAGGLIARGARAVFGSVVGSSIGSLNACFGSGNGSQNASRSNSGSYNGGTCNW